MVERLRPGLHRLWRAPGRLQVGLHPRLGVVLDGLSPSDEQLLTTLRRGATRQRLRLLAGRLGSTEHRADQLLDELRAAGVLAPVRTAAPDLGALPDAARRGLVPDATVLGLSRRGSDGWDVLASRRRRQVAVAGLGRTGLAVALGLASAGVGQVLVEDDDRVTAEDVAPGLYRPDDVGRPRGQAARDLLAEHRPTPRDEAAPAAPDLVVLLAHGALDPQRSDGLLREDVPHVAVTWGERHVEVGPLVVPGATSCLRCQHLHRTDRDPDWPRLVAQLAARAPGAPAPPEERSLAALAAALTVGHVLAHVDARASLLDPGSGTAGRPAGALVDRAVEVSLPGVTISSRPWPAHPRCGCTWPLGSSAAPPAAATGTSVGPAVTMTG